MGFWFYLCDFALSCHLNLIKSLVDCSSILADARGNSQEFNRFFIWLNRPCFRPSPETPCDKQMLHAGIYIYMGEERPLFFGEGDYSRVGCPGFLCVALKTFFGKLADKIYLSSPGFGVGFTILCVARQTSLDNQRIGPPGLGIGAPASFSGFESRLGSRVHKSLGLRRQSLGVAFLNPLEKHQIDWSWRRVSTMSGLGAPLLYNLASGEYNNLGVRAPPVFAKRMQPEAPNLADPRLQEHSICSPFGPSTSKIFCLLVLQ